MFFTSIRPSQSSAEQIMRPEGAASIRLQSCHNSTCLFYQQKGAFNVISHGRGRFKCKRCGVTWVSNRDDVSYGLRSDKEKINYAVHLMRIGFAIREIARLVGVSSSTVHRWKMRFTNFQKI